MSGKERIAYDVSKDDEERNFTGNYSERNKFYEELHCQPSINNATTSAVL